MNLKTACLFISILIPLVLEANTLSFTAQNIGAGQKQIDVTKTYSGLSVGSDYVFSFDVLGVNKPIQISDGTTILVVNSVGSYSISFTTTSTNQGFNFFHQSGGQPAKIEMDNLVITKSEEITELACTNVSNNDYRYGFNGMGKDDEVKSGVGNHYDFGARCYDSRLGRWLTIDPLQRKYPSMSPYIYVGNNVIKFTDPNGNDIIVTGESATDFTSMVSGFTTNIVVSRDETTGKLSYTYKEGQTKDNLSEFEKTLVKGIDQTDVIDVVAIKNSDKVLFDSDVRDGGTNEVDMGDFALLNGKEKFKEALVGHFLEERATSTSDFGKAHNEGIKKEEKILQEKYPGITARSANLVRQDIKGYEVKNADGSTTHYFKLLDYGSTTAGNSNALFIQYDTKAGDQPNLNSPTGVVTFKVIVKEIYKSDAIPDSDIEQ